MTYKNIFGKIVEYIANIIIYGSIAFIILFIFFSCVLLWALMLYVFSGNSNINQYDLYLVEFMYHYLINFVFCLFTVSLLGVTIKYTHNILIKPFI